MEPGEERILDKCGERICLFCGKELQQKWDEYTPYYECDCRDARLDREIDEKIQKLKLQRPEPNFFIEKRTVLCRIERDSNERRTLNE